MVSGEGFGFQDARDTRAMLRHAMASGITRFDTAPIYGRGQADALLTARHFKSASISTKTGLTWHRRTVRHDGSPAVIARDVRDSLTRLRRSKVDMIYLHWPDPNTPIIESVRALETIKNDGLTERIGLSNVSMAMLRSVQATCPVDGIQIRHSLLHNQLDMLRQVAQEYPTMHRSIYSVFEQGLLIHPHKPLSTRDRRHHNPFFSPAYRQMLQHSRLFSSPSVAQNTIYEWMVKMSPLVDEFVMGVRNLDQLHALLARTHHP